MLARLEAIHSLSKLLFPTQANETAANLQKIEIAYWDVIIKILYLSLNYFWGHDP